MRPIRPIVVLVCDDSAAAPMYFQLLRREFQHVSLRIVSTSAGKSAKVIVDTAIKEFKEHGGAKKQKHDAVWVALDCEGEAHLRQAAERQKQRAEAEGIKVALSDPCYEVWTLLLLKDTGQAFKDCQAVVRCLKLLWQKEFNQNFDRKKAQVDYSKIIDRRQKAMNRARRRREADDQSWTEIYQLIEYLESLVS